MALIDDTKIVDTVLGLLSAETPAYNTIIQPYHASRQINFFDHLRSVSSIPASNIPSVEIALTGSTPAWHAPRVLEDQANLEIHITTDNGNPKHGWRLNAKLVSFTIRILTRPAAILSHISGTPSHLYESLPGNVSYFSSKDGKLLSSVITWSGKYLEFLSNEEFGPLYGITGGQQC